MYCFFPSPLVESWKPIRVCSQHQQNGYSCGGRNDTIYKRICFGDERSDIQKCSFFVVVVVVWHSFKWVDNPVSNFSSSVLCQMSTTEVCSFSFCTTHLNWVACKWKSVWIYLCEFVCVSTSIVSMNSTVLTVRCF